MLLQHIGMSNYKLDTEQVKNIEKGETIFEKVHTTLVTDGMVCTVVYSEQKLSIQEELRNYHPFDCITDPKKG